MIFLRLGPLLYSNFAVINGKMMGYEQFAKDEIMVEWFPVQ